MHCSLFSVFKLSFWTFFISLRLFKKYQDESGSIYSYRYGEVHGLPSLAADLPCFLCGSIKALMAWQAGLTDSTGAGVLWG